MTTTTTDHNPRGLQPKAVEAGSRSYRMPAAPTRGAERKDEEAGRETLEEDDDENGEETDDVPRLTGQIPTGNDLKFDFDSFSFMAPTSEVEEKVHKRASNVMKLTQENEKLQARLKAMAEQLEEMERLRAQIAAKEQKISEKSSS